MSLLKDRQQRKLLVLMLVFALLLFLTGAFVSAAYGHGLRGQLLAREAAAASLLLEAGVDENTVALALNAASTSEEGWRLLEKLGHSDTAYFYLLPQAERELREFSRVVLPLSLLLGLLPFGFALAFLRQRERLYAEAARTIARFAQEDFSCHLPREEEGSVYRMFAAIDQLALSLRAKSQAAQEGRELLKEMISDISHQLKTPLAAITMYVDIISETPEDAGAVKHFSSLTRQALDRMERLISVLLKTARLDAAAVSFDIQRCRVTRLISQATEELLPRAERENKRLLFSGDSGTELCCDLEWTAEALGNVVKNALDHTGAGGEIKIAWEQGPTAVRIRVSDNGTGIAREDIYHIFKRFYRSAGSKGSQGVGLGLPLAKAVMEGQGGSISAGNRESGGAEFILSFPNCKPVFTGK